LTLPRAPPSSDAAVELHSIQKACRMGSSQSGNRAHVPFSGTLIKFRRSGRTSNSVVAQHEGQPTRKTSHDVLLRPVSGREDLGLACQSIRSCHEFAEKKVPQDRRVVRNREKERNIEFARRAAFLQERRQIGRRTANDAEKSRNMHLNSTALQLERVLLVEFQRTLAMEKMQAWNASQIRGYWSPCSHILSADFQQRYCFQLLNAFTHLRSTFSLATLLLVCSAKGTV